MSNEVPRQKIERLLRETGLTGFLEIFELPTEFSAPLLLAWKRLSLGHYIDNSAIKTVEPLLKDYAQMGVDCVHGLSLSQITEGVEILVRNFFFRYCNLLKIQTLDEYYGFIEEMPASAIEQGKDVVGEYVADRVEALTTELGILTQHLCSQAQKDEISDLTLQELLDYKIKPIQAELNTYLDW